MRDQIIRIFTSVAGLIIDNEYYEVESFNKESKLKKGSAYIWDDYVYIYRGKLSRFDLIDELKPGIYKNVEGEYTIVDHPPAVKDNFHLRHVIEANVNRIFDEMKNNENQFIDHDDIEIINNNLAAWTPTMKEDDDFLKYIVKKIIIDKKINLKNYKDKFANQFALNNLKSGLNKDTKMTVPNFKTWCEILGVKWTFIITDNGTDKLTPLVDDIEVESVDFL